MSCGSISYTLVMWFFVLLKKVFFRDVIIRGSHKIPKNGPVILVAGPHCNQFVDPIILISTCPRPVFFLMAAVSLKRKIVGFLGRMLGSIPVSRAQDYSKKCSGKVFFDGDDDSKLILKGDRSFFTKDVSVAMKEFNYQAAIMISHGNELFSAQIEEIINESELKLKKCFDSKLERALLEHKFNFSVAPIIDQGNLYNSVFEKLSLNHCIGIFPEGGSHDRAEMLPLKAGVSIMALGFASLFSDSELKIVPCGLNYFNAHKFRSRAVVEFGDPLEIDSELISEFKLGGERKRIAIEKHLKSLDEALKAVTVNVPDFETLQVVQAARRLYRPDETLKRPDMQIELNRRFVKGYLKFREDPKIKQLSQSISDYNNLLLAFGIKDHQVKKARIDTFYSIFRLFFHLSILVFFGLVSLPGFILNSPALYLTHIISKTKARAAKKASNIKIHGNDVISTWKLLVALVLLPLMYGAYSIILIYHALYFEPVPLYILFFEFVFCFCFIAWFSFATVRLSEMAINSYNSIKPLLIAIINPERCLILRKVRQTLHEQINFVVETIGPCVVDDFERNRIIKSPENSKSGLNIKSIDASSISSDNIGGLNFKYSFSNSSGDSISGRTSPVFDTNMESIEVMLAQCKEMLKKKID